jgi:tetratricopeptide (TPR) repeat protein
MQRIIITMLFFSLALCAQIKTESSELAYGRKLYEQGFYELAAQQFELFVRNYPQSTQAPEAQFQAGMCYFQMQDYDQASTAFRTTAITHASSGKALEAWYYHGLSLEKLAAFADAAKAFLNISYLAPESELAAPSLFRGGTNALLFGAYDDAESAARSIINRYADRSEYGPAHLLMAKISMARGAFSQALNWSRKALDILATENTSYKAEAYLLQAQILREQGRFVEALAVLTSMSTSLPEEKYKSLAALAMVEIYLLSNRLTEAGPLLATIERESLDDADKLRYHQSRTAMFLLQEDKTRAFQEAQYLLGSKSSKSLAYYARVLLAAGSYGNVLQLWKKEYERLEKEDVYGLYFSLTALQAAWFGTSPLARDIITQMRATWGETGQLPAVLAELLEKSYSENEVEQLNQWGNFFLRNYPNHNRADQIAYWLAASEASPQLRAEKLTLLQENYPLGDYPQEDALMPLGNKQLLSNDAFFQRILEIQLLTLSTGRSSEAIPLIAELYWRQGQGDKAEEILVGVDTENVSEAALLQINYLRALLAQEAYAMNRDREQLALAQSSLKYVVANGKSFHAREDASARLVDVTIALKSEEGISAAEIADYYNALINNFPESKNRDNWRLAIAASYLPEIIKRNDAAYTAVKENLQAIRKQPVTRTSDIFWQATYLLAEAESKVGNGDVALQLYREVAERAPRGKWHYLSLQATYGFEQSTAPSLASLRLYRLLEDYYYADKMWVFLRTVPPAKWPANSSAKLAAIFVRNPLTDPLFTDRDEGNLRIAMTLGDIHSGRGDHLKSLKYYTYVFVNSQDQQNNAEFLGKLALASEGAEQYEGAAYYYTRAAGVGAERDLYLARRALVLHQAGDFAAAVQEREAINLAKVPQPQRNRYAIAIYESLLQLQQKSQADAFFAKQKSVFAASKELTAGAAIAVGNYYLSNNQYDKAKRSFNAARRGGKGTELEDDAVFYEILVDVRLNRLEQAFAALGEFLDDYPQSSKTAEAYMTLGQMYYRSEKIDAAFNAYRKAVAAAREKNVWRLAMNNQIKLAFDMGMYNSAIEMAQAYVDSLPEAEDLSAKKIVIGKSYARVGQTDLAVQYLKKLKLEVDAESEPEIQFTIGEIYFSEGEYETAIVEFMKIPLMSRKTKLQWEASALYFSGQSYEKLGRTTDAVRMYEEIIARQGIMADLKNAARERIRQISG